MIQKLEYLKLHVQLRVYRLFVLYIKQSLELRKKRFHVGVTIPCMFISVNYAPEIEDRGHIVFILPVILQFRNSVILSETYIT